MGADVRSSRAAVEGRAPGRAIRVGHLVYCEVLGGSETVAAEICRGLDSLAYEPSVLSMVPGPGALPRYLEEKGIAFHRLRSAGVRKLLNPFYLAAKLKRLRLDVLHVHHVPLFIGAYRAARLAGIRAIGCTEHAKHSISRSRRLQDGTRAAARVADFFVAVSEDLKRYFVDDLSVPPESVLVIPNGVDITRFHPGPGHPSPANGSSGAAAGGRKLISVGRLAEAKDHPNLLAAIELLRREGEPVELILVGDGELRGALEAEIALRRLETAVTLAGVRTDPERLLREADVFVLSSSREGFPVVVLEAMASGLPVVSTRVGGVPEIVREGENGLMVPPGDPGALAAAIRRVSTDPALRASLGRNARETAVDRFSLDRAVERYGRLYRAALARRSR